jgi:hypothetical protein
MDCPDGLRDAGFADACRYRYALMSHNRRVGVQDGLHRPTNLCERRGGRDQRAWPVIQVSRIQAPDLCKRTDEGFKSQG